MMIRPSVLVRKQRHLHTQQISRNRVLTPAFACDARLRQIKQDVLNMMVQYLRNEKLFMSAVVIQDEANMKTAEQQVGFLFVEACFSGMDLVEVMLGSFASSSLIFLAEVLVCS